MKAKQLSKPSNLLISTAMLFVLLTVALLPARSQSPSNIDRDRGHVILKTIKDEIRKNYYDPAFHGIDLDKRFKQADEKIDLATSVGQIFGVVAQLLSEFADSHLFFVPPSRVNRTEYGWQMQMIGDKCYVVAVKPGSDAAAKGLKVGDLVYSVDGIAPLRENLWTLRYMYYSLRPRPGMRIAVQGPDGQQRQVDVRAQIKQGKQIIDLTAKGFSDNIWNLIRERENEDQLTRSRYHEIGNDLIIWNMPEFNLTEDAVDSVMSRIRKHKTLILDLRRNPGGYLDTLQRLTGYFFDQDIKIADQKRRKETKTLIAKTQGDRMFKGTLVVLVDSNSASSSEVFARNIQIEKRGTIIGDRTIGAVMVARSSRHQLGDETAVYYSLSVTDADLLMGDGKSLEHVGVMPDELLLPTAADLAASRDPVLSRAALLAGVKLEPEKAGGLFPIEWRK